MFRTTDTIYDTVHKVFRIYKKYNFFLIPSEYFFWQCPV